MRTNGSPIERLHDGNKNIPENSIKAFQHAVDHGFAIELDVLLTKEGIPVVHHDYTTKRSMPVERHINAMTLDEIKEQGIFGTEERIPTLEEVLELVDGKVPILVELKGETKGDDVAEQTALILDHYQGEYVIQSFNPMLVGWFKKNRPQVARGLLSTAYFKDSLKQPFVVKFLLSWMLLNVLARPHFINFNCEYPKNGMFRWMKAVYKLPATGWTFRDPETVKRLENDFSHFTFEGFLPEGDKDYA